MRKTITAAVVAASAATSACGHTRSEDGGPTVSRAYQVGAFDRIEVAGPYNVQVRTGSKPSASARGPEKLMERMVVEVKNGKLLIHSERDKGFFHFGGWHSRGSVELTVTVPQLHGATIAGSGDINVDKVGGDRFEGTVAGSGGLGVGTMDVQSLKLSIAGSGGVKAGAGKAQSAEYSIAGSGGVEAGAIAAQDVKVSIMGSGSVRANATRAADVSIMGSGDVDVTGGAKCTVHKAGSGSAHCS